MNKGYDKNNKPFVVLSSVALSHEMIEVSEVYVGMNEGN